MRVKRRDLHIALFYVIYIAGCLAFVLDIVGFYWSGFQEAPVGSYNDSVMAHILGFLVVLLAIYWIWNVLYSIGHLFIKSRNWKWFPIVIFLPVAGTFLYYNRFVLVRGDEDLPASKSGADRDIIPLISGIDIQNLMLRRLAAAVVDQLVVLAALSFSVQEFARNVNGQRLVTGWPAWGIVAFWFVWLPLEEFLFRKTIGKRLFSISVVDKRLHGLSLWRTTLRHLMDLPDIFLSLMLIVWRRPPGSLPRRFGDFIAGSYVVPDGILIESERQTCEPQMPEQPGIDNRNGET